MSTPTNTPPLAERADVHNSCKSMETLLNTLNEYCEAAGAVVALQKKLAKALRETATLKITGEIAGNAMHASANIFEALSEVDAKFAKVADKEYDGVSTEVKKWFKKLAKEEKNHDERMATANIKIKQAGQVYEKKSKKTTDVSEEHARYINLISTLGPEISQDKYNHALNVTQRHTATTYSVAASLSRLADSEWQRSFECVRRFSPTIGLLGQWRALCEGGWTGQAPSDLPDLDTAKNSPIETGLKPIEELRTGNRMTAEPQQAAIPPPGYSTGPPSASASTQDLPRDQQASSHSNNSPVLTRQSLPPAVKGSSSPEASATAGLEPPRPGFVDANTGSVRSLSAFPTPPTHFPIPPPRQQPQRQSSGLSQSLQSNSSGLGVPYNNAPMSDSPLSGNSDAEDSSFRTADQNFRDHSGSNSNSLPVSPDLGYRDEPRYGDEQPQISRGGVSATSANEIRRPIAVKSHTSLPQETYQQNPNSSRHGASSSVELKSMGSKPYNRDAYDDYIREFGVMNPASDASKAKTMDASKYSRPVERTDTGASSGSIVAAMRHRYSNNSGSTSPPPRDLPRLPLSVNINDLTSRYQPADVPLSPRAKAGSPPVMRQQSLPMLDTAARANQLESYQDRVSPLSSQHQQRKDDFDEADRRAKEQELKEREHELELRARELERDRARLQSLRADKEGDGYRGNSAAQAQGGQFGLRPRERRPSLRHPLGRPSSQLDVDNNDVDRENAVSGSSASPNLRRKYAQGATLVPPSPSGNNAVLSTTQPLHSPKPGQYSQLPTPTAESQYESRNRERYPDNSGYNSNTNSTNTSSHASNCGCESCSVSKYRASGKTGADQQQRQQQSRPTQATDRTQNQRADSKPEKPKSWMRRLSMPVGNAFSLDSKRQQNSGNSGTTTTTNNYSFGSGVGHTPSHGSRGLFSMDGRKNSSTTALNLRPPSDVKASGVLSGVQEDGQLATRGAGAAAGRRSYEASGISNRSMTNLGLMGRH